MSNNSQAQLSSSLGSSPANVSSPPPQSYTAGQIQQGTGTTAGASFATTATTTTAGSVNLTPHPSAGGFPSRRVTLGGMHQGMDNRRNSLGAPGGMDHPGGMGDIFGRRPSGFDVNMNMGDFLSRRDSLDSTTAVLDGAILELTRRRLSMAVGCTDVPPPVSVRPAPGHSQGVVTPANNYLGGNVNVNSGPLPGPVNTSQAVTSFAARQQQLQQQQRELEQRQKELERQRQQLLAGMQDAKNAMMQHQQQSAHSMMLGASSLALPTSLNAPPTGLARQQWWVCQVCNVKAFASHEEAMNHEAQCTDGVPVSEHSAYPLGGAETPAASTRNALANIGITTGTPVSVPPPPPTNVTNTNPASTPTEGGTSLRSSGEPYARMSSPMPLAMNSDKDWLTPLHCFVRRHCVQVFTATQNDVATPSKGKRKPIQVGQVGIRCPHCHSEESTSKARERGSVYYPTTISSIYNATMNLLQRHLHNCSAVPIDIMRRYETLKGDDARSGTSKRYWVESALSLGLIDTPNGIRFSSNRPPPLPSLSRQQHSTGAFSATRRNSNDFFSTVSNAVAELHNNNDGHTAIKAEADGEGICETEQTLANSAPLVTPEDEPYSTAFSFHLLSQMQPCVFTEADRLGKRKGLPPGFPGLACRHCFGGYGSGRFFPSSIKTLSDTSKTLNVLHNHMQRCRKCPQEVRETLERLRGTHDEERAKMKFGSQKAFFARIWSRLHKSGSTTDGANNNNLKRKAPSGGPNKSSTNNPPPAPAPPAPVDGNRSSNDVNDNSGGAGMLDPRFGPPMTAPPLGNIAGAPVPGAFPGLDPLAGAPGSSPSQPKRRRL